MPVGWLLFVGLVLFCLGTQLVTSLEAMIAERDENYNNYGCCAMIILKIHLFFYSFRPKWHAVVVIFSLSKIRNPTPLPLPSLPVTS